MHQLQFQVSLDRRTMNRTDFKANGGFSNKIGFRTKIFSGFYSVYSELSGPIGFRKLGISQINLKFGQNPLESETRLF